MLYGTISDAVVSSLRHPFRYPTRSPSIPKCCWGVRWQAGLSHLWTTPGEPDIVDLNWILTKNGDYINLGSNICN